MSRPREFGTRVQTSVRFDKDLYEALDAAAAERDVSVNYLVNKAVAEFLDRLIPVEEMRWTRDTTFGVGLEFGMAPSSGFTPETERT